MPRTLKSEDQISHYRIVGPLGAGGMGEVYRARDLSLPRDVALKILPPELVKSEERVRRFVLEAESASSLNHPHIVTIFEIGQDRVSSGSEGAPDSSPLHFISMELVAGKTLAVKIHQEKTDLKTLLGWLAQAAEGLAKAHAAGIVHRDLKPSNIMVSQDGYAKVLDFGLAKLIERQASNLDLSTAPTVTDDITHDGVQPGTVGYMSPEQVQGKPVDARSDIFSFGSVLYEAATRKRPFAAESDVETMHQIIHHTPTPIDEINKEAPAELRRLIRRCLAKDPNQRLDSMRTLALELREIVDEYDSLPSSSGSGTDAAAAAPRRRSVPTLIWVIGTVAVVTGLWVAWKQPWRSTAQGPGGVWRRITFTGRGYWPALSPDGTTISYVMVGTDGYQRLMVQDVKGGQAIEVFKGYSFYDTRWTGDGSAITLLGFSADSVRGGWLVPRMGGQPRWLGYGIPRLSPDGAWLAMYWAPWHRIRLTRMSDGDSTIINLLPEFDFLTQVEWSPDGERLLFTVRDAARTHLWTMRRDGQRQRKIHTDLERFVATWERGGKAIYVSGRRGGRTETRKVYLAGDGGPSRKETRLLITETSMEPGISISRDGRRMVCSRGSQQSNLWLWDPDASLPPRPLTEGTAKVGRPALSPDGTQLAFLSDAGGVSNIHLLTLATKVTRPLTFFDREVGAPCWAPDGRALAFVALDGDSLRVWLIGSEGGTPRPLKRTVLTTMSHVTWSPGREILYLRSGNRNMHILDPATGTDRPLVANDSVGWMFHPDWSADGRHVTVWWNRRAGVGIWAVSTDDTIQRRLTNTQSPYEARRWSDDGKAIYMVPEQAPWRIVRVGFPRGDTTTVLRLPIPGNQGSAADVDFTPDLRRVVYSVGTDDTDVWVYENFDPEVN